MNDRWLLSEVNRLENTIEHPLEQNAFRKTIFEAALRLLTRHPNEAGVLERLARMVARSKAEVDYQRGCPFDGDEQAMRYLCRTCSTKACA